MEGTGPSGTYPDDPDELTALSETGDVVARSKLARILAEQGNVEALTEQAERGNDYAIRALARILAEQGNVEALTEQAERGNPYAREAQAQTAAEQGDVDALTKLAAAAGHHRPAERELANLLAQRGDVDALAEQAKRGNSYAEQKLAKLPANPSESVRLTVSVKLEAAIDPATLAELWAAVAELSRLAMTVAERFPPPWADVEPSGQVTTAVGSVSQYPVRVLSAHYGSPWYVELTQQIDPSALLERGTWALGLTYLGNELRKGQQSGLLRVLWAVMTPTERARWRAERQDEAARSRAAARRAEAEADKAESEARTAAAGAAEAEHHMTLTLGPRSAHDLQNSLVDSGVNTAEAAAASDHLAVLFRRPLEVQVTEPPAEAG